MSDSQARQFSVSRTEAFGSGLSSLALRALATLQEGYIQALLSSQTSQAPPKRSFRIFRFIGGTMLLAWVGYNLVMILLNDKKSGLSFIFSSPQEVSNCRTRASCD